MRNLIENALKYSGGKEEVTVTVAPLAQGAGQGAGSRSRIEVSA
ncbi:hypothetical protein ACU4GD_03590 [Cupriavidus basilensis]